jgi:hypothetical protein
LINLPMTPAQYAAARTAIATPGGEVTSHSESGPWSGNFSTAQVSFSYSYDGTWLHLLVTAKRGLATFASEGTIQKKLQDLLTRLQVV